MNVRASLWALMFGNLAIGTGVMIIAWGRRAWA